MADNITKTSENSPIINVDLNTKSEKLNKFLSFFKTPIFISILIITLFISIISLVVYKTQVPELPQAGPKEKALGQLSNPKVTVVSYEDLECSACKAYQPTEKELIAKYKNQSVKFIFRHYPLDDVHPNPEEAAEASEYANDMGKFEDYKNKLFDAQGTVTFSLDNLVKFGIDLGFKGDEMKNRILGHMYKTRVKNEKALGDKTGKVTGTPSIFVDDQYVSTQNNSIPTTDNVSILIDQALNK